MVEKELLNQKLNALVLAKNKLSELNYNDEQYDEIEDILHELEDEFNEFFGDDLERILHDIHDEWCPDSEVLLPTAYLADRYFVDEEDTDGTVHYKFKKEMGTGVIVEMDDFPSVDTRLLLVPNPARIIFMLNSESKQELWRLK